MLALMRILLVVFAALSGYFIVLEVGNEHLAYVGLLSGFIIAVCALVFEERVKRTPLRVVLGGAVGLIAGLVVANLITYPLVLFNILSSFYLEIAAYLLTNSVIGYLGLSVGMKKGDEVTGLNVKAIRDELAGVLAAQREKEAKSAPEKEAPKKFLLDTSVIIDGRIAEVCETGFIEGVLLAPQFVLKELQQIADSPDPVKRTRGKRGLDILRQMQSSARVSVEVTDSDRPDIREVDLKLVAIAKETGARILTNDSNLNKIAELQGVVALNINKLATSLKPVVLPGELMNIQVVKEGKEYNQGIGYLEDGTMVVIDNAREHLGKTVDVSITSVLQTTGGRMIFSKVKEDLRRVI